MELEQADRRPLPPGLPELLEALAVARGLGTGHTTFEFRLVNGHLRAWFSHEGPIPAATLPRATIG